MNEDASEEDESLSYEEEVYLLGYVFNQIKALQEMMSDKEVVIEGFSMQIGDITSVSIDCKFAK